MEHVEETPARRNVLDEVRIYEGEPAKMVTIIMMLEQLMKIPTCQDHDENDCESYLEYCERNTSNEECSG